MASRIALVIRFALDGVRFVPEIGHALANFAGCPFSVSDSAGGCSIGWKSAGVCWISA